MYPKKLQYYFELAAKVALGGDQNRNFFVGSVGIRRDGVMVSARNGAVFSTDVANYNTIPISHSESRIVNKLSKGSVVYVARVARKDNGITSTGTPLFVMSKPCKGCQISLKVHGVSKAFYTIDVDSYGWIDFTTMTCKEFISKKDTIL